jgi:CBS domain-containing protein/GNAT superfamily N-acetyltransferase
MSAITFTESRPSDVLERLHASADAEREYLFASHHADTQDLILVAWSEDQAVGYLAATDERPTGLLIWEHVVVPEFRQRGIGRRLLLEAAKRTEPDATLLIDPMGELDSQRVVDYYSQFGFPPPDAAGRVVATAQMIVDRLGERREDATPIAELLETKAPGVVTISPGSKIGEALALMNDMNIGAVVASSDGSRVEGILSERDLLQGIGRQGENFLHELVGDCTTGDVVTATTTDLISDAMAVMTSRRIRHLPITEAGLLVGIVSVGDLLLFRLRGLDAHRSDFPNRAG